MGISACQTELRASTAAGSIENWIGVFRVRLDSAASTETQQSAWDVYQDATTSLIKSIRGGAAIQDPKAYGSAVARNSCRNYWRGKNPGWADLKGRLSRFFRHQPNWASWETPDQLGKVCGPANWQEQAMAAGNRVAALLDRPRRIDSSALPRSEMVAQLDATEWDRLLRGFFDFLKGPVRMDDLVSIAGVLFGVRGSRQMSFEEAGGADDED